MAIEEMSGEIIALAGSQTQSDASELPNPMQANCS
jgi:hypothetical protein